MKKISALFVLLLMLKPFHAFSAEYCLRIADFNRGEKPNLISGAYGSWNRTKWDRTQFSNEDFVTDPAIVYCGRGCSLAVYYDVDSPNPPVYNGFWMQLERIDLRDWRYLSFYVKGDEKEGFTTTFKVNIKSIQGKIASFTVKDVTSEWQEVIIPFDRMNQEADFSEAYEFLIIFDERDVTKLTGRIYLDEFYLYK
ncbi:MAG: hypothetical protein PHQ54_01020 [Candidatus Omnitrophica bacterium]|nr:hypothetical protein [Candidatus Omnitrophota bacterium]